MTLVRVSDATRCGALSTLETVASETPARSLTSRMVWRKRIDS